MTETKSDFADAMFERLMKGLEQGEEISDFLRTTESVTAMERAIEERRSPLEAVAAELSQRFPVLATSDPHRQFVGRAIRYALMPHGFIRTQTRPHLVGHPPFTRGRIYVRLLAPSQDAVKESSVKTEVHAVEIPVKLDKSVLSHLSKAQLRAVQGWVNELLETA